MYVGFGGGGGSGGGGGGFEGSGGFEGDGGGAGGQGLGWGERGVKKERTKRGTCMSTKHAGGAHLTAVVEVHAAPDLDRH